MGQILIYAKYLPTFLTVVDIIGKLVAVIQEKRAKDKPGLPNSIEYNRSIFEESSKLVKLLYQLLPARIRETATEAETQKFKDDLLVLSADIEKAIHSFQALITK